MSETSLKQAASMLRAARTGEPVSGLPENLCPQTVRDAYSIQDLTLDGAPIGGWKVSFAGGSPSCSPVQLDSVYPSGSVLSATRLRNPELEIELGIVLGKDLPPTGAAYGPDDIRDAIGEVIACMEIIGSRYVNRKQVSSLEILADFQSCNGIVKGAAGVPGLPRDSDALHVSAHIDGQLAHERVGGASADEILEAVAWLANHAVERNGGLKAGQVIITGARISPFKVHAVNRIDAKLADVGSVSVTID